MINKHKSNKIKENSNTVRHLNNGTDHRHSKSCCDQSSPARRTNNGWMDIHYILRIWTQGAIMCTVSRLNNCFTLLRLGATEVCALRVFLVYGCYHNGDYLTNEYSPSSAGLHDDVIKWKHVTGLLCGEFTGHRWIPPAMACDAELWCFLWSLPE